MSEEKSEWEMKREAATQCWKAMTPIQREAVLTLLKAWVPIRSRVSQFCTLDYDELRQVDDAWWGLKTAIVDRDVEIKEWEL
jgi:hypothetical protein